jgi:hypothetical protein
VPPSPSPFAASPAFSLDREIVAACVDVDERPTDAVFATAFERSLASLEPSQRRGSLGGITGHIAESVVEVVLEGFGWTPVWHFVGPGYHGADLLLLGPGAERLIAVEVKGTLQPRRWPRLRRGELAQMDVGWLDKSDNPAMQEWGVTSANVYGAIVLVNFHDLLFKAVLTRDFASWRPVDRLDQLEELDWLDHSKWPRVSRS